MAAPLERRHEFGYHAPLKVKAKIHSWTREMVVHMQNDLLRGPVILEDCSIGIRDHRLWRLAQEIILARIRGRK